MTVYIFGKRGSFMKKIVSLKILPCGYEEIKMSEMYLNTDFQTEKLPVNVILMEHRKFGHILINTGCSKEMKKNPAAYAKYLLKHKISFRREDTVIAQLEKDNMDSLCIKKVLLTHANAECCGALPLLPKYELLSTAQLLCVMRFDNDSDTILKSTFPKENIPMKAFNVYKGETPLKSCFKYVYDALGDGSVLAVDISGAANAMTGYFIPEENLFFAAEAAIDERVLEQDLFPSEKLLSMQYDADDYISVLATLRKLHREYPEIKFVFSHSNYK